MGWKTLSKSTRDDLLIRRDSGVPVERLAVEIDMRPTTLARRLREYASRSQGGSKPKAEVSFVESGNHATATSNSSRVRTLEQLLDRCEVDLGVWKVIDWGVKKWEVGAKAQWKDLTFTAGKIDGHVKEEGIQVEELWSVWAKFIRKNPIALYPMITPVVITTTYKAQPKTVASTFRSMVLADPHFGFSRDIASGKLTPFHDRLVLDIFLQVAEREQPDAIYILGDFFDFVMWTDKFLRSPKFEYTTQPAILEGHWWLRQLRIACPNAKIVIHEGNHDKRMKDSIIKHMRAAYGLKAADELDLPASMTPQKLLALHQLDIEWVNDYPSDVSWLTTELGLEHGDKIRQGAGATAKAVVQGSYQSKVFGHAHRKELGARTVHTSTGPVTILAYSPGCACRIDGAVPGRTKQQDWHQGFALIDHSVGRLFSLYDISIAHGGLAVWNREVYEGRERVEDLRKDIPEWNW